MSGGLEGEKNEYQLEKIMRAQSERTIELPESVLYAFREKVNKRAAGGAQAARTVSEVYHEL